jgi:16S rRNA (guanine966-N2)-methyltransferase
MRIVAGAARGMRLEVPAGKAVRPTTSIAREAIFEMLKAIVPLEGRRVLDLFAGSGALGIEALSRGAAEVTFVERDRVALGAIRRNLIRLPSGLQGKAQVAAADALAYGRRYGRDFDVVLADPPYGFSQWTVLLAGCGDAVVVAESERDLDEVDGMDLIRRRRYGTTHVHVFQPNPRPSRPVDSASGKGIEATVA